MSIAINISHIIQVLLSDGCWHTVADDSFDVDAYEYAEGPLHGDRLWLLRGGQEPLIPARGFSFIADTGDRISGPLTAILAVREKWSE